MPEGRSKRRHNPWSLPRGRVLRRALRSDPTQDYMVYVPESAVRGAPVLVAVHGVSRNAHEQAVVFSRLCDARGAVLLVPIFTKDQHRDYQRLGRKGRGPRVDLLLHRCLSEVASLSGADVAQIRLFGFSGGAQFAHRYLMAHPHRVARAVVAASGWYTFPDRARRFPYGIRVNRSLPGVHFVPEQFLRVPVKVLIGSRDLGSNKMRSSADLDAQQGTNRVERARRWVAAMRTAASAYGLRRRVSLTEVPDIDHSFTAFYERGALVDLVDRSLFGARRTRSSAIPAGRGVGSDRAAQHSAAAGERP
jgi:pimeloyl-ACP methyl ester carboxylesterase